MYILLEDAPLELDVREIGADPVENPDAVEDVRYVHAWSLAQVGRPASSRCRRRFDPASADERAE